jgi:hypothetical protein
MRKKALDPKTYLKGTLLQRISNKKNKTPEKKCNNANAFISHYQSQKIISNQFTKQHYYKGLLKPRLM